MNDTKQKTVFEERDELRRENELLKARLGATEEALAQVQRASAELREKYEAAKKVADAAVEYDQAKTTYDVDDAYGGLTGLVVEKMLAAHGAMRKAAREYRALAERPAAVEPDPCALVFYDTPALSPSKQAAVDRGIAKAGEIEKAWDRWERN